MVSKFMDNTKNDKYYVEKIKTDLKFVIDHTKEKTRPEIESNELLSIPLCFGLFKSRRIAEN